MSLLQNAIDAIEVGVEDFKSKDRRRLASAVRNFYAGVLLLLKEKLRRESPPGSSEALLYERISATRTPSEVVLVGSGKKTVDLQTIFQRFGDLSLALDRKRLERLAKIRNDFEHHVSKHAVKDVQAAIEATFVLVTSVMQDHLGEKPTDLVDLNIWDTMLSEAETYNEVRTRCGVSLRSLEGAPDDAIAMLECAQCPSCGSELLEAEGTDYLDFKFSCWACGDQCRLADVVSDAIEAHVHYDPRRGDEPVVATCHACDEVAFWIEKDTCMACGEGRWYKECLRCTAELSVEEQDNGGVCSYCHHISTKDD
jgi:hypothetical protein